MNLIVLCGTISDGRLSTPRTRPGVTVTLVSVNNVIAARGRKFDAIISTEAARAHPNYLVALEQVVPTLLGG